MRRAGERASERRGDRGRDGQGEGRREAEPAAAVSTPARPAGQDTAF